MPHNIRINKIILVGICAVSFPVHADFYTLNGIITDINGQDVPYSVGDQYSVTIELDLESQGYVSNSDGTMFLPNDATTTYYAAEYVSGDAVVGVSWDGFSEHYYSEATNTGTASINVLNNLAVYSPSVPSVNLWDSNTQIIFAQEFRSEDFSYNGIFGEITSFTVNDEIDSDEDGVPDSIDNCTLASNPGQQDVDGDGFGNACDADIDNNCVTSFVDIALFPDEFLSSNPVFDFDSSGAVNFGDFVIMTNYFLLPPGPSALTACN